MPLLRKKPFQRLHVSSDFRDEDEVFHCAVTNEIFKDYNEFCERIILCNSMIWSCSITGKSGMTYEEALQCEEHAKESLKEFPIELRIPILYLASKTTRTSFNEMMEDVFQYARERYFIGEMVEASFTEDTWCECHILQVIQPSEQQVNSYSAENKNPQERNYQPPAKLFRYEVEQLDSGDTDVSEIMIVEASQIRRRKQQYSRERNKIFLRMLCEQNTAGVWVVKENVLQKYGITKIRWDAIFDGPMPDFTPKPKKIVKQRQESIDKFLTSDSSKHRAFEKVDPLKKLNDSGMVTKKYKKPRMNGKYKEELKAKALEEKAKRKEERTQQNLEKKERKKALALYIKKWSKPRDDLEVEDLKPLPLAVPVKDSLLNAKFGEFAMILEFLQFFYDEIEVKTYFPNGLTLEMLQKAMLDKEVSGTLNDLIQLLLANIFKYQAEEEDEIEAETSEDLKESNITVDHKVSSMAEAVKLATMASSWSQTHQGYQLSDLALDYYSMSEILRQHLLSSGGRISEAASKWRYSQRGGYTNHDDPALLLRIEKPRILRVLSHRNICELDLDDRLTVIICLMNQLLTFASIRDVIDERYEKLFQAKKELRSFIAAEQKREKEEKEKLKEKEKEGIVVEETEPELKKVTRSNCKEEKKKEDYEEKLRELQQASRDDQMMVLLGYDRAYRKYWRLLSIPGVFVENVDPYYGTCLPQGTPYMPELSDPDVLYSYLKSKFEDENSDKENTIKKVKSPKKSLVDKNGMKSLNKDKKEILKSLMACTGNNDCPVHCKRPGPNWSFYGNEQDIENLINSLNEKGYRESELRNNLIHEKESIFAAINNCQKHKFNPNVFEEPPKDTSKTTKKTKNDGVQITYPPDMTIDNILELNLRDYILDLEDKIKVGCIGTIKVENREAWRNAINNNKYDKQCDKLYYGSNETPVELVINTAVDKIKSDSKSSRPGTPDSEVGNSTTKVYRDPGKYLGPRDKNEPVPNPAQQLSIKKMACAILQIYQAVEHKYLKKPLGDDKDKTYSCEEARDKWEQSLMASTSWAQLFVHINTLDNCIAWSRSATNAQCRICRKRRDAENMLLCDGCNKGHHLYCLKPKLTAVPEGDWFCIACKPKDSKPKEKAKKRRTNFEDEIEEEPSFTKETRHNRAKKVIESDGDDAEIEESEQETAQLCSVCQSDGKLISCDTCQKHFHIDCLEPPLARTPRGRWTCNICKSRKSNSSRAVTKGRERDRESERSSAATARSRIHGFAKSLLTKESKDYDSSASDDVEHSRTTRRSAKRAAEVTHAEEERRDIKNCKASIQELLSDIKKHRDSWPFMTPVTTQEVPDYYDYITEPMDFGTIKMKFENNEYHSLQEFFKDCLLVFDNCNTYNTENSTVYNYVFRAGLRLIKYLEKRCKELNIPFDEDTIRQPLQKSKKIQRNGEQNGMSHSEDNDSNYS